MSTIVGFDLRALDRARISRDPRFDGRFFIAVTSTGIYCRPVCPVPSPQRRNIRYYPTAAAAADAGFRPCLRCRPEAAPGTPAWLGTSAIVRRALRLIDDGVLDAASVDALAARVGVGARHLSRLFAQYVGASPLTVAQTRRLHFAKRLLDETNLALTEIALAAGFGSLRRFNAAFQRSYRRSPRDLRRTRRGGVVTGDTGHDIVLRLAFRPPYDWNHMHGFLAVRALPGVERVDARGYARTIAVDRGHATVCIRPLDGEHAMELRVRGVAPAALFQMSAAARRVFDLAADPRVICSAFKGDRLLAPLVTRRPGLRIPGIWDPFEGAVRAVIGQQVSVAAGRTFAARLVARAGQPIASGTDGLTHLFPTARAIASADLGGLGLTGARVATLRALARAVADGAIDFSAPADEVVAALTAVHGVGAWTAQYVALRGLNEPDAFPSGDVVLRKLASANGTPLTDRALDARADAWRPWRAYAVLHLWCAAAG
jgi:AraC family transcriptional regulator of adaptative response / DNA-3-methyladenine glycosylase II